MSMSVIDHGSGSDTSQTTIGTIKPPDQTHTYADLLKLADHVGWYRNLTRAAIDEGTLLHEKFTESQDQALGKGLSALTGQKKLEQLVDLLAQLGKRGFAWSDLARVFGVSVPALRKWRKGESATPENHMKVAQFVALCELIEQRNPRIRNAAEWMEMPLVADVSVTGLDLVIDGRTDLVLRCVQDEEAEAVLDAYRPDWRDETDSDFVVVTGPDGLPAIAFARDR